MLQNQRCIRLVKHSLTGLILSVLASAHTNDNDMWYVNMHSGMEDSNLPQLDKYTGRCALSALEAFKLAGALRCNGLSLAVLFSGPCRHVGTES